MTLWCNFQQFFWHHGHILPSGVWGVGKLIVITQHLHLQQLRNHVLTCIKSATGINKFSVEREQWKREGYKSLILLPVSIYIYIYIYIFFFIYLYIYIYIYIYIQLQTVLFRPSGPHQCSADTRMEVRPYSHPKWSHTCGII